jgi:hypothetical protein
MMIQMRAKEDLPVEKAANGNGMTCEAFQDKIPELIGSDAGNIHDHPHLKTCARCTALVADLEYIGEMAKDLFGDGFEPPDTLWPKISKSLAPGMDKDSPKNGSGSVTNS